jgi:uncharacterized membrane protein YdjX (TVP38/TMEM64 family)
MERLFGLIKARKTEALWLLCFALLPLLAGSGMVLLAIEQSEILKEFSFQSWALLFLFLSIPIACSLIPNTLAGLMAGYFLGWYGLAGMTLSFSIACLFGYFLGSLSGKGFIEEVCRLWPVLEGVLARFRTRPLSLAFSLRLMPAPPFAVGSLLLAWLHLPLKAVFWGSVAGMIPRMALVVWIGHLAGDLSRVVHNPSSDLRLSIPFTFFAGLGILVFYLRFLRKSN